MLRIGEIKDKLQDRNAEAVAEATNIHPNTIRAIKNGKNTNPSYDVTLKLSIYLVEK